ncbi:MAG: alkyl sulfatase dimerization domain-containing protein [Acidimicrobiales bacterium]|nr:alkyl sulfatase dimerization domain-containing protein [Acidimicrobiales bacterium]
MSAAPQPASEATRLANAAAAASLPLEDTTDHELATRGLVATHPTGRIDRADGRAAWDTSAHDFVRDAGAAPDTVNPSLWRQAKLNSIHGLFEVVPGVWQARGYDLSNVTFVAGDTGWIVIDPLTTAETAAACLALADEHLGARPVVAVIYTHSHVDHFGGVHGVVDEDDVVAGRVRIIAPTGFMAEAVSENVIAGPAMSRRAQYMYGGLLPVSPTGHVDAGLGKTTPKGTVGLIAPTEEIAETGTELVLDGVRLVFQYTPGTEAPAEMNFLFPDLRLLCMAENCTATMHNVYTPRGAQVRDALAWSKYIAEAIELFAADADVCFASHHWPRWGVDEVRRFLTQQRDLYRWLHDQTMRLANHGLTAVEIAEELDSLPPELADEFHARGYYGTINHNVKAVYQRYLGWFDANPANLHTLPPTETGRRYVELMGGADAVIAAGRSAFDAGEYRWVAELVNHVVFADPENRAARSLQADALEQLGYQAESGPWRNFYLTGAQELRAEGPPPSGEGRAGGGLLAALSVEQIFDALGVRLNGPAAAGKRILVNWRFTDLGEDHILGLENGALHHVAGRHAADAAATVTISRALLAQILAGTTTFPDQVAAGSATIEGDVDALVELFDHLDRFAAWFPIVTP